MVKAEWFKRYGEKERPERFERTVQSWDTANKATELSDYSVCTTWGVRDKDLFLLGVFRRRLNTRRSSARCASSRACSVRPRC
jgi:phage terminase large subunit-like protein